MKLYQISRSDFDQIEPTRRVIAHDHPHQFAILDLGEKLGYYGLSWRSSPIIQPEIVVSPDRKTVWIGVDQKLVAINLQEGNIVLSMSLHSHLFQIVALENCLAVLSELDLLLFNQNDQSLRCWEGLPEIASEMTVNETDLIVRMIDANQIVFSLKTLQVKELSKSNQPIAT